MDAHVHAVATANVDRKYIALIHVFPLAPIRSEEHYTSAIAILDRLFDRSDLSTSEEDYRDVLVDLVGDWEDENVELPQVTGIAVLRHLMEEHRLKQKDLVPIFGTKSIVSEVLSGKRKMTIEHVRRLADYFHVSAELFIP